MENAQFICLKHKGEKPISICFDENCHQRHQLLCDLCQPFHYAHMEKVTPVGKMIMVCQ